MSAVGIDTAPLKGRKQTMQFRGQFYAQPSDGQISPPPVSGPAAVARRVPVRLSAASLSFRDGLDQILTIQPLDYLDCAGRTAPA
jgi:hypothetical protein